jgi:hypothetical protein
MGVLGDVTAERHRRSVRSAPRMAVAAGRFGSWVSEKAENHLSPAKGEKLPGGVVFEW